MTALGVRLTFLIGPTIPLPAPPPLTEALEGVEVTQSDEGRSGFQLTFVIGRDGQADALDYRLFSLPQLKPFSRAVLTVTFNATPRVLLDGIITHQQLSPGDKPGAARLTVTGEDISVMMDLEERSAEHPAQDETAIAYKIIGSYAQYGLIPAVIPPAAFDLPSPTERIPVQQGTDLQYLQDIAGRFGYVFYVKPGPAPLTNTAYWGPPVRAGIPQKAITVNMGPETNVESLDFQHNSLAPNLVSGTVQDRATNQALPVETGFSLRLPLASQPALAANQPNVRRVQFRGSGLNAAQALARAQGMVDASADNVVTATGELDALRYGDLLWARELVGVRGVGFQYDGFYYVKSVTHSLRKGEYKQRFTLEREGTGSTSPVVRV